MLRVREIMTTDVITVNPETTLREAMELFASRHVSGAPVVAGGKVVGVVSTTDLMMFAAAMSGVPTEREAPEEWPDDVDAGVVDRSDSDDESSPAFFAELWDDAGAEVTSRIEATRSPEWSVLEEHDVSEVMTRTPLETLAPNASVEWAADLMRRRRIHRILITEGETLFGIVTALDIVDAVADHRLTTHEFVFNDIRPRDER
jgi:CBS domain-containing protein